SVERNFETTDQQSFSFAKNFFAADGYEIGLENKYSKNKERIAYSINVVKDQYPEIVVNNLKDTVLYSRVLLGGMVSDDHGVTQLTLNFTVRDEDQNEVSKNSVRIPVNRN